MPSINDTINASMLRDPRWTPHPERASGGTKYIATFLNRRGDAIALDLVLVARTPSGSRHA
jgi:hypothetical protein